jgi:ribosomal protein S1
MKYLGCSVIIFAISLFIGCSHLNVNKGEDKLSYTGTALVVKKAAVDNEKEIVYCDLYLISDRNDFLAIENLSEKNCAQLKVGDQVKIKVKNNKVVHFNEKNLP